MTWSGYAFDPQHRLLVVNTNNFIAKVKLIPRADFWRDDVRTEDGEYSPQAGAPYGLFRRFLQSPSDMPCTAPPWGMLTAVDMTEGKIRWQVPLGSMQDFGGKQPPVPPGSINLGGPITTAEDWFSSRELSIPSFAPSTSKPEKNYGRRSCRAADTRHP